MMTISRSALLPYSASAVYQLVNDIESYPKYMQGCVGAKILRREADVIEARLDIAKSGIRHSFSTRNYLREAESIRMELLEGPFDSFEGCWTFQALSDEACKVTLALEFKLSSKLLGAAAAKVFESVATDLVDALVKQAKQLLK